MKGICQIEGQPEEEGIVHKLETRVSQRVLQHKVSLPYIYRLLSPILIYDRIVLARKTVLNSDVRGIIISYIEFSEC